LVILKKRGACEGCRLRGGGRELPRQHGLRARVPQPAARAVGRRGRGRLLRGRAGAAPPRMPLFSRLTRKEELCRYSYALLVVEL